MMKSRCARERHLLRPRRAPRSRPRMRPELLAGAPPAASGLLDTLHRLLTALVVILGLALIYLGADWVASGSNNNWGFGAILAVVGAQAVLLASLAATDVAASLVAIAWTVATALLFLLVLNAPVQAWTLAGTAVAQALSTIVAQMRPSAPGSVVDPNVIFEPPSPASSRYGALSSFVDPLSSSSRLSPKTSPQLEPARTPSPFGTRSSPIRPGTAAASASAARMTLPPTSSVSAATPADVRAHYTSLVDKYGLGATPP